MEPALKPRRLILSSCCMPEVGVEPTHPKVHEFESCASANSATPACGQLVYGGVLAMSIAARPEEYLSRWLNLLVDFVLC